MAFYVNVYMKTIRSRNSQFDSHEKFCLLRFDRSAAGGAIPPRIIAQTLKLHGRILSG